MVKSDTSGRFLFKDNGKTAPEKLKESPTTTPVSRPDETAAAKNPDIAFLE